MSPVTKEDRQRSLKVIGNATVRYSAWPYLLSFPTYSQILVENREIYIPYLDFTPVDSDPVLSEFRTDI